MKTRLQYWIPWVYFLGFCVLGIAGPYLTEELKEKGVRNLGLVLVLPFVIRIIVTPIWGILADHLQRWDLVLRLATFLSAFGFLGLALWDPSLAFVAMLIHAVGRAPLPPIVDSLAIEAGNGNAKDFGRFRRWGSIGFLVSVFGISAAKQYYNVEALVVGSVLAFVLFAVSWGLPSPKQVEQPDLKRALRLLFSDKLLRYILLCSALHFGAHSAGGVFLAVHVSSLGLPTIWTGIAVASGVALEIFLMSNSRWLMERFTEVHLLLFATVLAFFRWMGTFMVSSGIGLTLCQLTHGLTFGCFYLAVVSMVSSRSPKDAPVTGQALLASAMGGFGAGGGVFLASQIEYYHSTRYIFAANMVLALFASVIAYYLCLKLSPKTQIG